MGLLKPSIIVLFLILFSFFQIPALAEKKPYIVYLGSHAHGPEITEVDLDRVVEYHCDFLGSFWEGVKERARESIFISYKRHINGFAALLEEEEADQIAEHPKVVSVFPEKVLELHTTRSWGFMMLEDQNGDIARDSIWEKANFGEDIIIAHLDSGVWPTAKSFDDEGYGPIPSRWKGTCQKSDDGFACNRKLIGARHFSKSYEYWGGLLNSTTRSARDHQGHGSHTLSTAGGNFVHGANVLGAGNGTAKGGAPRARVATYKVCWPPTFLGGCFEADVLEAMDLAIDDGVDVISLSLGGGAENYWKDSMAIGAFHATKKGIVVVASAGNSGPNPRSVTNISPWMITVGASSLDRQFRGVVELKDGLRFKGLSLSPTLPEKKFYPLITGAQAKNAQANTTADAMMCRLEALDPAKVKGKILVCQRGFLPNVEMGKNAALAGAVGMILCNDIYNGNTISADAHYLPASHLTFDDCLTLTTHMDVTRNPEATLLPPAATIDNDTPAPSMGYFSSSGPSRIVPDILKPDVTAPGVNILAAFTEDISITGLQDDSRRAKFNLLSGTSMSCPHVAGVAALLKAINRDWSPAAIRSAIFTTARTRDNTGNPIQTSNKDKATPFHYGGGHIRPNRAADPGLVYDLTTTDYLNLLCSIGYNETQIQAFNHEPFSCPSKNVTVLNFNYPSVTVKNLTDPVTVTRTVKNVGNPGTYVVQVREPVGVSVYVEPKILTFEKYGEEKSFRITLKDKGYGFEGYHFGGFVWTDGKHYVRSPIGVQTNPPEI